MTMKRITPTLLGLALSVPAGAAPQPEPPTGGAVVSNGRGTVGLFLGGPGAAVGGNSRDGFEGVYIGPDGKPQRLRLKVGEPLAVPGGVTFFDPAGFDPFDFAFGPGNGPFGTMSRERVPATFDQDAARAAVRRGDPAAALRQADAALRTMPDHPDVLQTRVLALFALGRSEDAGRAARHALAVADPWDWPTVRGFFARPDDYLRKVNRLRKDLTARSAAPTDLQWLAAYHAMVLSRTSEARTALTVLAQGPDSDLAREQLDRLPPDDPADP